MYIAATNHYDRLDKAALRGGRFEEKIRFDVPEREDMRAYASRKLADMTRNRYTVASGVLDRCVMVLDGRSIGDADAVITNAVNIAAVRAMRGSVAQLRVSDVSFAARAVFVENVDISATS
jgi:transitional endoplasmic reticulum ATPase